MDCWSNYRFRKEHLHDLNTALRIPNEFRFGCRRFRGKISGEKAFLFTLHRLATVQRLVDFEKEYGRSYDQLSRIFTRVVGHIFAAWSHLLLNNLAFFLRFDSYHTEIMDVLPSHLITDEIRRF
jgi:hypothetical protein